MQNLYTGEVMWNPIRDWVTLSSIHKHPTKDAADGPGNTLLISGDDEDDDAQSSGSCLGEFDPVMTDLLRIQQDYVEDHRRHKNDQERLRRQRKKAT